jgi:hypothetical protein
MAKFEIREGEEVTARFDVSLVDGAKALRSALVITNQRLVVVAGRKQSFFENMFGIMGRVSTQMVTGSLGGRITYEIARDRFAGVEAGEGKVIVFRDDGEGYAHTSFSIVRDLLTNNDDVAVWQQRMHAWASQSAPAAPLPAATLHNSRK